MEIRKSCEKVISPYNCKFQLRDGIITIECFSLDNIQQMSAKFSADNIPQDVKISIANTAQELYDFIEARQNQKNISINSQNCIILSYEIGKKKKSFKLPLLKKYINQKSEQTFKLKKENYSLKEKIAELESWIKISQQRSHILFTQKDAYERCGNCKNTKCWYDCHCNAWYGKKKEHFNQTECTCLCHPTMEQKSNQ